MYDACRLLVGGVRVVSMCKLMGVQANVRTRMRASLLLYYVVSLWMTSFRVSARDYIDMLRYYLHLGVLGVPVLPVCGGEWSLVVHFDDLRLFECGSLIVLRPSVCMYITVHPFATYSDLCVVR
jgi:hypothetical protein